MSAPARISSWVISAVTTLPATIVLSGHFSLSSFTASTKRIVYPFATSSPINLYRCSFVLRTSISSIPPIIHKLYPAPNAFGSFLR